MKLINTLLLALFVSSTSAALLSVESDAWINNKSWEMAFNSGNTAELANLYTEDAIIIPPSLEIFNTQKEIMQYWKKQIMTGTDNFRVQTINLRRDGDTIYQTAVWIATITSNGIATDLDGEMTNVIAQQQDGSWKIKLQSWN